MKKYMVVILSLSVLLFADEGEQLFDAKCAVCHIKTRPTQEMKSSLLAPPISGVIKNVKKAFGDDKEASLAFIGAYTLEPSLDKSKCKPKAIARFGIMPSQKGNVSVEELNKIALYLYDNFPLAKQNKKMRVE